MRFPKPYADFVQRFRVPAGFLLLAAFVVLSKPTATAMLLGLPLVLSGIALRVWAAGHLRKNTALTVSGPYAHTRNPLYLGSLAASAGFVVASRSWTLAALFAAAFALVYLPVMQQEGDHLSKLFPGYAEYASRVPMFFPKPGPAGELPFSWDVFRANKEHKAILGMAFGLAALAAKVFWLPHSW